jgi:hypothetical protein
MYFYKLKLTCPKIFLKKFCLIFKEFIPYFCRSLYIDTVGHGEDEVLGAAAWAMILHEIDRNKENRKKPQKKNELQKHR